MGVIWYQSSKFNPSSIEHIFYGVNPVILYSMGVVLELAHLIEFGILYLLVLIALLSFGDLTGNKEKFAIIITVVYASVDEIHQIFIPYRSFSLIDMLKNVVGLWVFWFVIHRSYYGKKSTKVKSFLHGVTNPFTKPPINHGSEKTYFK